MSFCCNLIDQSHQAGNRCVEFQVLNIRGNLLDGTMNLHLKFLGNRLFGKNICQSGYTVKEFLASFYRAVAPRSRCTVITHEQYIGTKGICTVFFYDIQRIDYISLGFTHLVSIWSKNQTLDGTLCVRFWCIYNTQIIQEMMPESGVNHMSGNVFHTTVVPVNRHPVFEFVHISQCLCVVRISVS